MSSDENYAFEKILISVGDNGIYQKRLYWWFVIPLTFIIPWVALVPIFQASVPDHWCLVPNKPENTSTEEWKNLTIPWEKKDDSLRLSQCQQYVELAPGIFSDNSTSVCQNGWEYDHTWYDNTLPMQLDWVCDKDEYPASWLSVGVAGNVIGTVIFSLSSDKIGRKNVLLGILQLYAVSSIVKVYVTSPWALFTANFISSMGFPAIIEVCLILVLEQVAGSMRAKITSMCFNMWTAGMSILPLLAWLTRDWVLLGIVTAVPFFLFIIGWWLLLESPRWTLTTGRVEETYKILNNISRINKNKCPDLKRSIEAYNMEHSNTSGDSHLSFLKLFSLPTIRMRTFLLTMSYMCNNLVYYGLIYNISNMSGNEFLNFFLISITEIPVNLLAWYCAQKLGRRWTQTGFFILCALIGSIAIFIPTSWAIAMTTILVICKSVINGSFLITYIQLAEIYPTTHRASGAGFSSIVSSIVGISGPYIAYSSVYWFKLPYIIIVLISLVGSVVAAFIPETLGAKMPQNIQEANEFLTDQPFWSYYGKKFRKRRFRQELREIT